MTVGRHIRILLPVSILTTCNHPHVILQPTAKFRSNRTNIAAVINFQDDGHRVRNLLLSLGVVTAFV